MKIILFLAFIVFAVLFVNEKKKANGSTSNQSIHLEPENAEKETLPVAGAYQKKWLLTYNEKDAYKALKAFCDENNLYLMTKVRLLDLAEPVKGNPKYKTYLYKIQSKHIDFVICDEKLVARCMIELDDNSHNQMDRIARDQFVDQVLQSVGYKIIHVKAVTDQTKEEILKTFNK